MDVTACVRRRLPAGTVLLPVTLAAMVCAAGPALAQSPAAAALKVDTGDTAWLLAASALVMFMTPGLALFYGGMVRAKNVLNTLMHSFVALALVSVLWIVVGYSLAFAPGNPFIGGLQWIGLAHVGAQPSPWYGPTVPHQAFVIFQMMFAIITPALISGAIAERMKFGTYFVFIALWSLLIYCPLAHMVWGRDGLLSNLGTLDFAGGIVVHISAGVSALVLAVVLGKRRLDAMEDLRPHSMPLVLLGTGMLWFGWFGFNAGSALTSGALASSTFLTTHGAAAMGALTWVVLEWIVLKQPTALGLATGAIAGLGSITPASGFVTPLAGLAIGITASVIAFYAIRLKAKLGYDDTLDVFGVHGVGGTLGTLATGLLASKAVNAAGANGLFYGGGLTLLAKQAAGVGVVLVLAVGGTLAIALALKATMGLSVDGETETAGLDLTQHGESAYSGPGGSNEAEQELVPVG